MRKNDTDCVILCGGLGTRLQTVVRDVPKVMAEVNGRPFLDYVIEHLKSQGIERVVLCTGYKAEMVERYYRARPFDLTIDFSKENEPLGTGGALKHARHAGLSDPFIVLNGDSYLAAKLKAFLEFHDKKNSLASMLVVSAKEKGDFGNLMLDDRDQIIEFREKAQTSDEHLVNAGIYCFNHAIFSVMPDEKKFSLEHDLFPKLIGKGFYGYRVEAEFLDIGTPLRYEAVKQKLKKGDDVGY